MNWPKPTRLVSPLALALLAAFFGCRQVKGTPLALAASASATPPKAPSAAPPPPPPSATPAPAAPAPTPAPVAPISSVLVLGDSLSDEKVAGGIYVKRLREKCAGVPFDNRAKGGFMVNQMRRRLENEVLPEGKRYSHAIVFGGVNDLYSDQTANRSLARIEDDLSRIYASLAARGVQVVAITVTPWGDFKRWFTPARSQNTLTLNTWLKARPAAGAVHSVVDAYPLLSCGDPERLCPALALPHKDGLHFGKAGQEKLADALLAGPFSSCKR